MSRSIHPVQARLSRQRHSSRSNTLILLGSIRPIQVHSSRSDPFVPFSPLSRTGPFVPFKSIRPVSSIRIIHVNSFKSIHLVQVHSSRDFRTCKFFFFYSLFSVFLFLLLYFVSYSFSIHLFFYLFFSIDYFIFLPSPKIPSSRGFLKQTTNSFTEAEKHIVMQMDEIHVKSDVTYKGGKIYGSSLSPEDPIKTVFAIMVSSLQKK